MLNLVGRGCHCVSRRAKSLKGHPWEQVFYKEYGTICQLLHTLLQEMLFGGQQCRLEGVCNTSVTSILDLGGKVHSHV